MIPFGHLWGGTRDLQPYDIVDQVRLVFPGFPYSKLVNRTLYLQVLDYDRFSRDDPIGEVCIPLADVDLAQGETMWKSLQPCKGHTVSSQ